MDEVIKVIIQILAIIAYILIISHYLPRSRVWNAAVNAVTELKARWEGHRIPTIAYSLHYEVPAIVIAGVLLNLAGWGITSRNPHILYLDMAGTATAGFLLGPWWGAIVGMLSPFVIAQIYPTDSSLILVPWMLVNMTGGIFWGLTARTPKFRRYVNNENPGILSQTKGHLSFLLWSGVIAAGFLAIAGVVVSRALGDSPAIFARSPDFAEKLQQVFNEVQAWLQQHPTISKSATILTILTYLFKWAITAFRYIPDKTISAAVGLLTAKYVFPLFEYKLMRRDDAKPLNWDNWLTPTIGLACFGALVPWSMNHSSAARWLWYLPAAVFLSGLIWELLLGGDSKTLIAERNLRVKFYLDARAKMPPQQYFGAMVLAVLFASLVFMVGLTIIGPSTKGTIARYFLGTVLTYFMAFYVMRVSMRQWVTFLLSRN